MQNSCLTVSYIHSLVLNDVFKLTCHCNAGKACGRGCLGTMPGPWSPAISLYSSLFPGLWQTASRLLERRTRHRGNWEALLSRTSTRTRSLRSARSHFTMKKLSRQEHRHLCIPSTFQEMRAPDTGYLHGGPSVATGTGHSVGRPAQLW